MSKQQHFRSQIIPGNPGTMVYWVETEGEKDSDILPENIPEGAIVTDVTFAHDERRVRKSGDAFIAV